MDRIEGRVAVVTGAASGNRSGAREHIRRGGCTVVLADVEQAPLDAAVRRLRADGHHAIGVRTDVRRQREVRHLAEATTREFGAVHITVQQRGSGERRSVQRHPACHLGVGYGRQFLGRGARLPGISCRCCVPRTRGTS